MHEERDGYRLSNEVEVDLDTAERWLAQESYWARGRPRATIERSLATSRVFSVHRDEELCALCRVVGDESTFAWVCDVYVDPAHRGRGIGHWMVDAATQWAVSSGARVLLATRDAHSLYQDLGFAPLEAPERWLEYRRGGHGGVVGRPLSQVVADLRPVLRPDPVAVVKGPVDGATILAQVEEPEGPTCVVSLADATRLGLPVGLTAAWITLAAPTELTDVGVTAAVAALLAQRGIACNVLAGFHHDHLLVPWPRAEEALAALAGDGTAR